METSNPSVEISDKMADDIGENTHTHRNHWHSENGVTTTLKHKNHSVTSYDHTHTHTYVTTIQNKTTHKPLNKQNRENSMNG